MSHQRQRATTKSGRPISAKRQRNAQFRPSLPLLSFTFTTLFLHYIVTYVLVKLEYHLNLRMSESDELVLAVILLECVL